MYFPNDQQPKPRTTKRTNERTSWNFQGRYAEGVLRHVQEHAKQQQQRRRRQRQQAPQTKTEKQAEGREEEDGEEEDEEKEDGDGDGDGSDDYYDYVILLRLDQAVRDDYMQLVPLRDASPNALGSLDERGLGNLVWHENILGIPGALLGCVVDVLHVCSGYVRVCAMDACACACARVCVNSAEMLDEKPKR